MNGFVETTVEILDGGSDVNARVIEGISHFHDSMTPLILACKREVHRSNHTTDTALSALAARMVSILISRGAEVNTLDREGRSALHHAAEAGSCDVIRQLLEAGADLHVNDEKGRTAMH